MTETILISPATQSTLHELAARTGQRPDELLAAAVEAYRAHLVRLPISEILGVDPMEIWEAAAEAEAGKLTSHDAVFGRLRARE